MENFNEPGSDKIGITPVFTDFITELQLQNLAKILDAKIERSRIYNSNNRDEVSHKITITYNV